MSHSTTRAVTPLRAAAFAIISGAVLITSALATASEPASRTFKVQDRTFQGEPKTICVIEGKWSDGEPFRYEGWDECSELRVKSASLAAYKNWAPRGRKGAPTVADIPAGSEVIEIGNDFSTVLVFRDRTGELSEVLVRD